MRLTPGARIGPYELTGPLGAGGMGEVYRARDARLNRDVAIKILPPLFAADPERIARFDREAQVLASLNHPNIAHIYGIEDAHAASAPAADGERSAEWPAKTDTQLRALVMELVGGEDLSERIARGPLPLGDALAIARQIAEALACAHEQGIVHRDLKPANVKVREDGTVKVLDFGLARLVDPSPGSSPSAALSPTITSPATQLGVILGTAAYMAPEQARGKAVDKRADVWAFGVVLFEMLTGRRAFEGSEVSDTLAFILTKDPDWSALPADVPAAIRRLLRRCLQKDPRHRLADMSDARLELDEAASPPESERAAPLLKRARWLVPAMAAAIAAAALLGAVAAWLLLRPPAAPSPPLASFSILLPEGVEFTNAGRHVVAISQDGRRIVYVANRQLYLREIGSVAVTPIAGSETAGPVIGPAFSPDGQQLVFYSDGALRRLAVAGGTPMPVAATGSPLGVQWTADGIFVGLGAEGIARIPTEGGKPATIAAVEPDESAQGPQLLPGGDVIIFTIATGVLETRWDKARIVAHSLRTGERKVLIEGGSDARYVPTGHLLYAESGVMYAVPFDPATLAVGARAPVLEGVHRQSVTGAAQFAVSSNGTVAYLPGPMRPTEQRVIGHLERSGKQVALPVPVGAYETPRVSPDGSLVAVGRYAEPLADIWIYDLSGSSAIRRLTSGGSNRFPAWSPDGRQVVFQSDRDGDAGLYVQNADGSGASRLTKAEAGSSHVADSWSRDGQSLLFTSVGSTTALHVLSLKDRTVKPLDHDAAAGSGSGAFSGLRSAGGVFSPAGGWLAYYSARAAGEIEVFVEPFPETGAKYPITRAIHPAWSGDGRELFTSPNGPEFVVFRITTSPRFTFREAARIRRVGSVGGTPDRVRNYDVMPDGRLLVVMTTADRTAELREIRVMLNWFEELERR